jgi:DNA-directed RNA polymerase specialized sigma24 family protein
MNSGDQGESMAFGNPRFCTTRWTVVLGAGGSAGGRAAALEQFCRTYWYPVYAFVRSHGVPPEDAADRTQSFFTHLLETNWLEGVERRETRFSTLLLTILKRFLVSVHRMETAAKRGGGCVKVPLDTLQAESWYAAELVHGETPEALFGRRWALAVMDSAYRALAQRAAAAGRGAHFERLGPFLSREPRKGEYEAIGDAMGLGSRSVAVAVHRLRQEFRDALRRELGAESLPVSRVDEELAHLMEALRCPPRSSDSR